MLARLIYSGPTQAVRGVGLARCDEWLGSLTASQPVWNANFENCGFVDRNAATRPTRRSACSQ
jgi:hypothetical protein